VVVSHELPSLFAIGDNGIFLDAASKRPIAHGSPKEMLAELSSDNQQLTRSLRVSHEVCDRHNDFATASLIENWIDESERRTWFLFEALQDL